MKILVIDDSAIHQKSARQVLGDSHDLTVVGSHDEALKLLEAQHDEKRGEQLKAKYMAEGMDRWDAYQKSQSESELPYWDAVLSDLLMPAGKNAQGGEGLKYVGQEMPIGWSLAIQAALMGAKYVAVVTDMNHHNHPASAMLDRIGKVFQIQQAGALFTNHVKMVGIKGTEKMCGECSGTGKKHRDDGSTYECYRCDKAGTDYAEKGKDWGSILQRLINPEADS